MIPRLFWALSCVRVLSLRGVSTDRHVSAVSSMLNLRLPVDAYQDLLVPELFHCLLACKNDQDCKALNHHVPTQRCHLLNSSRHFASVRLRPDTGWVYSDNPWHGCYNGDALVPGSFCAPAESCKQIIAERRSAKSGAYWLKTSVAASRKTLVHCHMEHIPECLNLTGWSLAMKLNGVMETFNYSSPYWSDRTAYQPENGAKGLDDQETKTAVYWSTPFEHICLGMKSSGRVRWVGLKLQASSLLDLIGGGSYHKTHKPKVDWLQLLNDASLQEKCNRQGVNVACGSTFARLGILSNNELTCASCDSTLGFGLRCNYANGYPSCGNFNMFLDDEGYKPSLGYVLVY